MPKERRDRSTSLHRCRPSPFHCSSSRSRRSSSRNPTEVEDIKEWEEVRCPVCMEHPHNAVLLLCSSHDKGCRPYMCDTSYRHSNCLDQFRKAFTESASLSPAFVTHVENLSEAWPLRASSSHSTDQRDRVTDSDVHAAQDGQQAADAICEHQEMPKLSCPLCRGEINGWIVVESARRFMNTKTRSCAQESCTYSGTYSDLRKHARHEHPLARPSEVDPDRQRDWRRLERQRDLGDVLSTIRSAMPGALMFEDSFEVDGESDLTGHEVELPSDEGNWWTVLLLFRVFRPGSPLNREWVFPSRYRGVTRTRRRTTSAPVARRSLWGESYEEVGGASANSSTANNGEGVSGSPRQQDGDRPGTSDEI
ncbi:uncharacterized protein LOC116258594 [Nymphaea colorata]|uniref:uncharacterized protein LOC116258594 n=1 Tax=Nymphaea colorata TaxID=210225 RepID=UPI00129ED7C2|nr:uncharacterized protein LOC116258594 [Nymphaea colorata]XP_031491663.1 uncharacterized protein LOC116258594 [Nymphaea colorata]XP_031491669.1 uncharacterized protein LOC116258594 [Nymphaea colorata]XP_049935323.1 uncharacterized protein LOC116258594 [Nymphaea colorata]